MFILCCIKVLTVGDNILIIILPPWSSYYYTWMWEEILLGFHTLFKNSTFNHISLGLTPVDTWRGLISFHHYFLIKLQDSTIWLWGNCGDDSFQILSYTFLVNMLYLVATALQSDWESGHRTTLWDASHLYFYFLLIMSIVTGYRGNTKGKRRTQWWLNWFLPIIFYGALIIDRTAKHDVLRLVCGLVQTLGGVRSGRGLWQESIRQTTESSRNL